MKEEIFLLQGAQVYLAMLDTCAGPWVMGIHGSGREALSYRDVPFYARQRDFALQNGCAFAAVSMGQKVWATEEGFEKLEMLYAWMKGQGYWEKCVPMASSAGGTQMYRFAQLHPDRVAALVGIFTVWDVEKIRLKSLERAWGMEGDALRAAVAPRNPARTPELLPDVPIVICHGLHDAAVPIEEHTLALAARRPIRLFMTEEGHSIQSFGLYENPLIDQALGDYARGKI